MSEYTTEQRALYHTNLAARRLMAMGQYDAAATIMLAGADGYENIRLSSVQTQVSTSER